MRKVDWITVEGEWMEARGWKKGKKTMIRVCDGEFKLGLQGCAINFCRKFKVGEMTFTEVSQL